MSDQFFWFATRSAGIMAWFAATFSIVVGLLIPTRALGRKPTIPWLVDLHRYLGGMSVVFLIIHLVTLWADEFVNFGPADLLIPWVAEVPGLSRWSLAIGVIAGWLLVAIEASSLIKDRIAPRTWHTIHLTSFAVMVAGAVHGLEAGSDTDNVLLVALAASVAMAVAILTAMRVYFVITDRQRYADEPSAREVLDDRRRRRAEAVSAPADRRSAQEPRPRARPAPMEPVADAPRAPHRRQPPPITSSTRIIELDEDRPDPGRWFEDDHR